MNCTVNTVAIDVNYCAEDIVIEGWAAPESMLLRDAATGRRQSVATTVEGGNTKVGVYGLLEPGHVYMLTTPDGAPITFNGEVVNRVYFKAVKVFDGDAVECAEAVTLTPMT